MALEESRFFDSVENDNSYYADDFAEFFRMFLKDGVRADGGQFGSFSQAMLFLSLWDMVQRWCRAMAIGLKMIIQEKNN